jgi:hypothetical protein
MKLKTGMWIFYEMELHQIIDIRKSHIPKRVNYDLDNGIMKTYTFDIIDKVIELNLKNLNITKIFKENYDRNYLYFKKIYAVCLNWCNISEYVYSLWINACNSNDEKKVKENYSLLVAFFIEIEHQLKNFSSSSFDAKIQGITIFNFGGL